MKSLVGWIRRRPTASSKGRWVWYLAAVVVPFVLRVASVWLSRLIGWGLESDPQLPSSLTELAGSVLVVSLYTMIWAGGCGSGCRWSMLRFIPQELRLPDKPVGEAFGQG